MERRDARLPSGSSAQRGSKREKERDAEMREEVIEGRQEAGSEWSPGQRTGRPRDKNLRSRRKKKSHWRWRCWSEWMDERVNHCAKPTNPTFWGLWEGSMGVCQSEKGVSECECGRTVREKDGGGGVCSVREDTLQWLWLKYGPINMRSIELQLHSSLHSSAPTPILPCTTHTHTHTFTHTQCFTHSYAHRYHSAPPLHLVFYYGPVYSLAVKLRKLAATFNTFLKLTAVFSVEKWNRTLTLHFL